MLKRPEAAGYCGVSPGKFDELVRGGIYPRETMRAGRLVLWDRAQLDLAIDRMSDSGAIGWDDVKP